MRLTRSQQELLDVSREPVKGFRVDVIEIHQDHSGVSHALREIRRQPFINFPTMPRNVSLEADRPWNAVMSMVKIAGQDCYGSGYLDTIWRCMDRLSRQSGDTSPISKQPEIGSCPRRSLCLWLEDARHMKTWERETLAANFEFAAERLGISVRLVFLVGKVKVWDFKLCKRVSMFIHSERLDMRARKYTFTREGLEEVSVEPGLLNAAPEREEPAVARKSA